MIEVQITGSALVSKALQLKAKRLQDELRVAMTRSAYRLRTEARKAYDAAGLQVRTGALKGSIDVGAIENTGEGIRATVFAGQGLPYARAQEYGATIRPKKSSFLAIPIGAAKSGRGVARFSPREITSNGYTGSFFAHGVLFGSNPGQPPEPLFALKRSVTIRARPFMRPALMRTRPIAVEEIKQAIERVTRP